MPPQPPAPRDQKSTNYMFWIFLGVNVVASLINHIDDTDETYGYWEPLHYFLYGKGMQTWEYAPEYAIRSYAFIALMWPFAFLYKLAGFTKPDIFMGCRLILASFTAYAERRYIVAIRDRFGSAYMRLNMVILIMSPGVFFASTSFLPSAVAMSLTMLFLGAWLKGEFVVAIAWACMSVLCTGWPFVGLVYLPFGLHMLQRRYAEQGFAKGVVTICWRGALVLAFFAAAATGVDYVAYGKLTSPTLNIFLYNAGGTQDTLYGVSPLNYYIRNLFLTMTVSWPVALTAPLVYLREYLNLPTFASVKSRDTMKCFATIAVSAVMWCSVLFYRPHKEERFMYPVYPLLAFMATSVIVFISDYIGDLVADVRGERVPLALSEEFRIIDAISASSNSRGEKYKEMEEKIVGGTWAYRLKHAVVVLFLASLICVGFSRITSNYWNYGGYIRAWGEAHVHIPRHVRNTPYMAAKDEITVCTGTEWHYFPSHFFLPDNARLAFVRDGFFGQLPQPFDSSKGLLHGMSQTPVQPVNDNNKEEKSRYTAVTDCDFAVATVSANPELDSSPMLRKMTIFREASDRSKLVDEELDLLYFDPTDRQPVLDQESSKKQLYRAFFVPFLSSVHNKYKEYMLLTHVKIELGDLGSME